MSENTFDAGRVSPSFLLAQQNGYEAPKAPVAEVAGPTVSEQMAEAAAPIERPAGAPETFPFQGLPRRQKAVWLGSMGPVLDTASKMDDMATDTDGESFSTDDLDDLDDLGVLGDLYAMLAGMEELLLACAVRPAEMRTWLDACSDEDVVALFSWYVERFSLGEAKA